MDMYTLWCSGKDLAFSARGPMQVRVWGGQYFFSFVRSIITRFVFYSGWSLGVAIPSFAVQHTKLFSALHCKAENGVRAYMSRATLLSGQFFFFFSIAQCVSFEKKKKNYQTKNHACTIILASSAKEGEDSDSRSSYLIAINDSFVELVIMRYSKKPVGRTSYSTYRQYVKKITEAVKPTVAIITRQLSI